MGLLIAYAFAVPWEYSLDLGEPFGNVARVAGVLMLGAAMTGVLLDQCVSRLGALQWLVLGLFGYFAVSVFWSLDLDTTSDKIRAYFQVMMVVWIAWEAAQSERDLRNLLRAFVAGCWVLAVLTYLDFSSASAVAAEQIRFVAEGQDPNDVARFLDLGIPLATLLFVTERAWWMKVLAIGYVPGGLLAVLLTASRGGFSASLVALIGSALLLLSWKPKAAAYVLGGMALMASAVWVFVPLESIARLATIPEQLGAGDLNDRLSLWIAGWRAFERSPWFGYGAGTYATASGLNPGDTAHNTAMAVLVMGGILGLSLLVAIVVAVVVAVLRTKGMLRLSLGTSLVVWMITAMVGSVEENRSTWLLFALMAVAGRMAQDGTLFNGDLGPAAKSKLGLWRIPKPQMLLR